MSVLLRAVSLLLALPAVSGCTWLGQGIDPFPAGAVQRHPDVLAAELQPVGDGTFDVHVTISSPYDTPARYADGWRVLDPAGKVLGVHTLRHDHATEQPFTRTQRGLRIDEGIDEVTIEGRDLVHGYGGETVTVEVPR